MSAFEEVKITGIDPARPPRIRKEDYIDLYFKLNQEAPLDWSEDFNALGRLLSHGAKIDKNVRGCIETYINDMTGIAAHLQIIKSKVSACNEQYLEKIRQKDAALAASNADLQGQTGEQNRLNQIIATLEFDT